MGADLCSDLNNSNSIFTNIPTKKKSLMQNNKSPTIKENVSIYSNSEQDIIPNKYFDNETEVNNLKSSIFDNEENDHTKKYEQEINTYEHAYLYNKNNNYNDISDSNRKEYTFKNSLNNSKKKILDYNKSKNFINNNKSSFKKFEALKNKNNQNNQDICSFGNLKNSELDINKNNNNSSNNSVDENDQNNELVLNNFINKDEAKKKINSFDSKVMNKFAMNQLKKIQKRVRKSIANKNMQIDDNYQFNNFLPSLNIINSSKDRTIINNEKNFCVRYYKNGSIYIGQIKNNKCNGYGKYNTQDDDLFMGIFNNNYLHIYGIIERRTINSIYEGELQNNTFNGIGIESFKDGATYYGQFFNNQKHGIGTYIWGDDSQYQGEWKNGEMNGLGIFWDDKGRNYEGGWVNGKMDGSGIFRWADGRKYLGFFKNDKREGFGIYMLKNPLKIYNGFWKDGIQNGITIILKQGNKSLSRLYTSD